MRRPLVIYDFATAPFWISLYMRNIFFSFLSVYGLLPQNEDTGALVDLEDGKVGKVLAMLQAFYDEIEDAQAKASSKQW